MYADSEGHDRPVQLHERSILPERAFIVENVTLGLPICWTCVTTAN